MFLIPWTCFNGIFVIANSLSQVQLEKSGLKSIISFNFHAVSVQEANLSKVNDSAFVSHSLETILRNVRITTSLTSRILQQYNNGFKAEFKNTIVEERKNSSLSSAAFPIVLTMQTTRKGQ